MERNVGEKVSLESLRNALRSLKSKIEFDSEGRIKYGGVRYVFMDQELFMLSFEGIMDVLGSSMKMLMYPSLEITGYTVANQLMSQGIPPEKVLEAYAEYSAVRGWGVSEVVRKDFSKPEVVVRMYNQLIAEWLRRNVKDLTARFPFYECGWGANWVGVVKAVLEKQGRGSIKLTFKEPKCLARGDDYCEFVVEGEE
ncbi:MAG: hypothetical protein QXK94_03225 [Candidatus Jordarchaeales archaeon]